MQPQPTVMQGGDASGNGRILRWDFPSGLRVYSLPTPNYYGGEWDLGPTWNYLVEAERPFLVDAGRWGQGGRLVEMLASLGRERELDFVLLSHGHEDHDGGLGEVVARTGAKVKAHATYGRLLRRYPELAPPGPKRGFPAKCWRCFMPPEFYQPNCLAYHDQCARQAVEAIGDGRQQLAPGLETLHLPGHSPDALALLLGDEAVLVGDTVLPHISPWPTSRALHRLTAPVLGDLYPRADQLYGLARYLRSLKELGALGRERPGLMVLPAHRLYYNGRSHPLDLAARVEELIQHHIDRCADILRILAKGPQDAAAIAQAHFEAAMLAGPGLMMAQDEILCHCELLLEAGDLAPGGDGTYLTTGAQGFEDFILAL